jgi:hypothetical protein
MKIIHILTILVGVAVFGLSGCSNGSHGGSIGGSGSGSFQGSGSVNTSRN